MTRVVAGAIPALIDYYRRCLAGTDRDVAESGYSAQGIGFCVVLGPDGSLRDVEDIRGRGPKGKPFAPPMVVPTRDTRTNNIAPQFCWDKAAYVFGRGVPDKDAPDRPARLFAAFRDLHLAARDEMAGDAGFEALCRFLGRWDPDGRARLPHWDDVASGQLVFRVDGLDGYVHESPAVRSAWARRVAEPGDAVVGPSLVDGGECVLARLHPQFKRVAYAKSTGAGLVSFDQAAFRARGKEQGYNAPVGVHDCRRYKEALASLLGDDTRKAVVGELTGVFWSDCAAGADAEDLCRHILGMPLPGAASADEGHDRVRAILEAARAGRLADPGAPFYVLWLAPNVTRLAVRVWLATTVGEFAARVDAHAERLRGVDRPAIPTPSIPGILAEAQSSRWRRPSPLTNAVVDGVFGSVPGLPAALLDPVLARIRVDGEASPRRIAVIGALAGRGGEMDLEGDVNPEHPSKAYHCGRAAAVFEFAQSLAIPHVEADIVKRNWGALLAAPGATIGRLKAMVDRVYIPKLPRDVAAFVRDEFAGIVARFGDDPPRQMSGHEQALSMAGRVLEGKRLDLVASQIRARRRVRTERHDWVRSTYERLAANAMYRLGVPYIYESKALLDDRNVCPDFVVRVAPGRDLFIEVLGMTTPKYAEDWERKRAAYIRCGITPEGGPNGRLIVIDFRERQDERLVLAALRPFLDDRDARGETETRGIDPCPAH